MKETINDLGCFCTINGYYGDPWDDDTFNDFIMKSNRDQVCCECGETIPASIPHQYVSACWDGFWGRYRTCLTCKAIRESYCCTWIYGSLREHIWGELGLDYITGETDEDE